ncbi:phosphopantothenoylcysteine decarboxylase isoform X4 [Vicugna pacos]|uniref:Phosphopantothenoylcysteine decarboxylase isoform X4 n=1 Tax=Vicugna pacos TaxID=30538 RepID=A0A6J0APK8_VICPA|nr:phosphopantothenoylcysteine decarboxylase isoform X3 [Vicugna pacos]
MEPSCGGLPGLEATRPHVKPKATCSAAAPLEERRFRVLVGVTGSVAALKLPLLVSRLLDIPGTCVIRAWDRSKPLLFCPAMNTAMWEHPITEQQVGQLKAFGYVEVPCVAKKLVCGDQGTAFRRSHSWRSLAFGTSAPWWGTQLPRSQGSLGVGKTMRFPTDHAVRPGALEIKISHLLGDSVLPLKPVRGLRDQGHH